MVDADELNRAKNKLLEQAIEHGRFGYYLDQGFKEGRVSSIVLATTDPEVIGKLVPVISEIQQLGRGSY